MAITTDYDGSATITLSDGTAVRLPGLNASPNATAQDIRNVATALVLLVDKLDKRITELEKRRSGIVSTATSPQK
jgi:hypothetical protein